MKLIAILVVSFGTTYPKTRRKTIGAIENKFKERFPQAEIFRAFTSTVVISKIAQKESLQIDTPIEALRKIKKHQFRKVYIQPLHIIPGIEFHRLLQQARQFEGNFEQMVIGQPLLSSYEDYVHIIKFLKNIKSFSDPNEAILFMGHGTSSQSFTAYACLDHMLTGSRHYLGAVESFPNIGFEINRLKKDHVSKVTIQPFMIVAGNHAHHDMASEESKSWRHLLEKEGIQVKTQLKGLGEYPFIQKMFINHLINKLKEG
ncbi:sirohydrochlorin cobaltochelatase [Lentilactobacillus raoultii]|uniref:Sirohydrochlorin cobaltochelatase n=1 Tax=Lentilactobacillus raoultii TaxID=1987503 RepID=A0ABW3PE16_9LACO|nr:sirohydrochlorin cobaltochelatase [Lentilactobacillus raoultii]